MPTIRLVPSAYSVSSGASVSNPSNMYTNTDSTTYATLTHTNRNTNSYYVYIKGFNFSAIPSGATVDSFTVKIKGYESGESTSSSYAPCLVNGTSALSGTTASSNFGSSSSTITIPTGSLTWAQIAGYGSSFGVKVTLRRNNKNTQGYKYIQGVEIDVTYTLAITHDVTITGKDTNPSGTVTVNEGDSLTIQMTGRSAKPNVTDNNVDVTSQVQEVTGGTASGHPVSETHSGFGGSGSLSSMYADYTSTSYGYYETYSIFRAGTSDLIFNPISVPSGTSIAVSCKATFGFYNYQATSNLYTATAQLYSGNTAKGSVTTVINQYGDMARTVFDLSPGTWTAEELASDIRLRIIVADSESTSSATQRVIRVYGATITVTYTAPAGTYVYTLSNITANHTIVVTDASPGAKTLYFKNNGAWVQASKAYKKVNGIWVQQSDLTQVFDPNTNYVKG